MKIISKFKDYYDTASSYGIDKEVLYVRTPQKTKLTSDQNGFGRLNSYIRGYEVEKRLIGFCGEIYPLLVLYPTDDTSGYKRISGAKPIICYSREEFLRYHSVKKSRTYYRYRFDAPLDMFYSQDYSSCKELFQSLKAPIFMVSVAHRETFVETNIKLKDLNFYRIKDSATAFQDIFQFVSGVLAGSENPMVQISDKDKIAKRGFDKWSFRKQSPKLQK